MKGERRPAAAAARISGGRSRPGLPPEALPTKVFSAKGNVAYPILLLR